MAPTMNTGSRETGIGMRVRDSLGHSTGAFAEIKSNNFSMVEALTVMSDN